MQEDNHTAGPWFWADEFKTIDGRRTWSLVGSGGFGILSCDGEENAPHRHYDGSNANLIAAAPDLLEALKGVIRVADRKTVEFDAAHAAIAKATKLD